MTELLRRREDEVQPPQTCTMCGKPGWSRWSDARLARQKWIRGWQGRVPGPAPVLTAGRCDATGKRQGLYHLGRPYVIEAQTRITRCPLCELFAWRAEDEPDQCRVRCRRLDLPAAASWWEELLDPRGGLIRQQRRLSEALCPPSLAAPDELRLAAGRMSAMADLFVEGAAHCLRMLAAVSPADGNSIRGLSSRVMAEHDSQDRRDMWRYVTLLQGLAAGQLPLLQYREVHGLLSRVVVAETASTLLARVQVNSTWPHLWRLVGAIL